MSWNNTILGGIRGRCSSTPTALTSGATPVRPPVAPTNTTRIQEPQDLGYPRWNVTDYYWDIHGFYHKIHPSNGTTITAQELTDRFYFVDGRYILRDLNNPDHKQDQDNTFAVG
jgi:hypothetical protein